MKIRRLERQNIGTLKAALAEAGSIIGSQETLDKCNAMVSPKIGMMYKVSVTMACDGTWSVNVKATTQGHGRVVARMNHIGTIQ